MRKPPKWVSESHVPTIDKPSSLPQIVDNHSQLQRHAGSTLQVKSPVKQPSNHYSSVPSKLLKKTKVLNPEEDFATMKQRFEDLDRKIKEIISEHNQLYTEFMQDVKMPPVNRNHNI